MTKHCFAVAVCIVSSCLTGCVEANQAALEAGVVISVHPADQAGENTGAGAIAGAVAGSLVGVAFGGRGAGQVLAGVIGASVGATTGSIVENAGQTQNGIAYTIRLSENRLVTIVEHHNAADPIFPAGSTVGVQTRGRTQHIVSLYR